MPFPILSPEDMRKYVALYGPVAQNSAGETAQAGYDAMSAQFPGLGKGTTVTLTLKLA